MSEDQAIAAIGMLAAMTLVGSALARRRMPAATWLPLALIWAGIIAMVWIAVLLGQKLALW